MSARVALLRGINVGRGNRVAMIDLRRCLEQAGLMSVRTLLASGNVVFEAPVSTSDAELAATIHDRILDAFEIDVRVLVLNGETMRAVVAENPWSDRDLDPSRVLVGLPMLGTSVEPARALESRDWGDEELFVGDSAVFLHCANGISAGELADETLARLGTAVTTRNWRTLLRIVDSMAEIG